MKRSINVLVLLILHVSALNSRTINSVMNGLVYNRYKKRIFSRDLSAKNILDI